MNKLCDNTEVHDFHHFDGTVEVFCSGQTTCAEKAHDGHWIKRSTSLWCPGICDCNGKKDHGPGEHK